jgi:hypothetical protein
MVESREAWQESQMDPLGQIWMKQIMAETDRIVVWLRDASDAYAPRRDRDLV